MGYNLIGQNVYFDTSLSTYPKLLTLAYVYGWTPRWTEMDADWYADFYNAPREEAERRASSWDGSYFSNDGQWVTREDAAAMAAALDRASSDIPEHRVERPEADFDDLWDNWKCYADASQATKVRQWLLAFFGGPGGRTRVREFADFARAGGYATW